MGTHRHSLLGLGLTVLSLLVLGAHALRGGDRGMAVSLAALAVLACTRQGWLRWAVGAALAWGVILWVETGMDLMLLRLMTGQPWVRLVCIMSGVALMTALAGGYVLIRGGGWYDRGREHAPYQAAMFLLTIVLLLAVRAKVVFPLLLADRYFPGWGMLQVFGLGIYAAWVGGLMFENGRSRRIRPRIWALFSFMFFLQLGLGLLGMDRMLMTGELHLPVPALIAGGPVFRGGGFFMLTLYGATLLLVGPAWCSHLCYIGAWDDLAAGRGRLRPKPNMQGRRPWTRWSWNRMFTLGLTIGAALLLRAAGVSGLTAVWLAAAFGLAGVGVMVFVSRKAGVMVHCTAYCPLGVVSNLLGKINPWRVRLGENCTACGVCSKVCRYGALQEQDIAARVPGITCTLCGDCVSVCPHSAANYHFPGLSAWTARAAFLTLTISLHALFLGVARI